MPRNIWIVILIFFVFFIISFLTNILGPIIPDIIDSFKLSIGFAGFLPFAFFIAYGIMSIPAGILLEKYSAKPLMLAAFFMAFGGAFMFALFPTFTVAMFSLFSIGIGMAILQVVINPLLRQAGGEEHFAFNSVLAQLFFGAASFISPLLYSYLVQNLHSSNTSAPIELFNTLVSPDLKWVSLYWVFAATALVAAIIIQLVKFPKVELKEDEKIDTGAAFKDLLGNRIVLLFFLGIFSYVGTEQGVANWTSKFLQTYHSVDPSTTGATVISYFWGLLTIGCLLGLVLLKLLDSRTVLVIFSGGAILSLAAALFGPTQVALLAFPLTGFFASVMWSIIVSLALNSVRQHHGTFAGILCTGIAGGAVVPLIVGGIAELTGLKVAMLFLFIPLGYIFSIGIWARPLIKNATIKHFSELFKPSQV
ncbi:sugar MFS transporter [Rhodocytophaga rosea]|uniref:Sugar MFS transporter n=1 Tax=Rhodocytophaga rosea TaxID=2704465 RepID=A0A6C0GDY0_9BACT|nr:MFS transporter [Rhodocytophaga rosea]QHT65890.1 sugar MFS transporter [Rhodocytophaga rosea]